MMGFSEFKFRAKNNKWFLITFILGLLVILFNLMVLVFNIVQLVRVNKSAISLSASFSTLNIIAVSVDALILLVIIILKVSKKI